MMRRAVQGLGVRIFQGVEETKRRRRGGRICIQRERAREPKATKSLQASLFENNKLTELS